MRLIAIVRAPTDREAAAAALGGGAHLTLAEARLRLAPEPPALLANLAPEAAEELVATLRQAGLAVLSVEATLPSEAQRTVARTLVLGPAAGKGVRVFLA